RNKGALFGRTRLRLALLRFFARLTAPLIPRSSFLVSDPSSLLLIRPDHMGDLLFTTPALRALRAALPQARITALVGPWGRDVVERNPHLDEVLTCPFPWFSRQPRTSILEPYRLLWAEARKLRAQEFDAAVILRFDHWWGALLAYLARIPVRVGYDVAECRPFLTQAVPYTPGRHEVEQNLALIEAVTGQQPEASSQRPGLEFEPTAEERAFAVHFLAQHGVVASAHLRTQQRPALSTGPVSGCEVASAHPRTRQRPALSTGPVSACEGESELLVGLHPGAGAPVKLWRPEAFAQVADALAREHGARILITGSAAEVPLARAIAQRMTASPIIAAGQTSLGQLAALLARCRLVIGVDSGPMHLAVAQDVPTVHLYGPVDHRTFGPWGDPARHRVVLSDLSCIPCNRLDYAPHELADHPCVRSITVPQVLEAANALLKNRPPVV
ncbi:MAG: glycosyltransferase family 9 protein, partial [Anaerolineae bacterium]